MPLNVFCFFQTVRSWRIDVDEVPDRKTLSTPIINVLPIIMDPEKPPLDEKQPPAIAPPRASRTQQALVSGLSLPVTDQHIPHDRNPQAPEHQLDIVFITVFGVGRNIATIAEIFSLSLIFPES